MVLALLALSLAAATSTFAVPRAAFASSDYGDDHHGCDNWCDYHHHDYNNCDDNCDDSCDSCDNGCDWNNCDSCDWQDNGHDHGHYYGDDCNCDDNNGDDY
ncbi:MAG TPA: hypothetical protein VHA09_08270 [Nitrososphaera sp.]|nr:hypothetical protein [Nitrososphaera sp.]